MSMSTAVRELRELVTSFGADPRNIFVEFRGSSGIEYRGPIEDLVVLVRTLEEEGMWLRLERDKAAAKLEAEQKHSSFIYERLASIDNRFITKFGDIDFSEIEKRVYNIQEGSGGPPPDGLY
jgi:hypothetical protein